MLKFITLDRLKLFLDELKKFIALVTRQQVDVTYEELVYLRDNTQLVPGRLYRITDFVTTVYSASGNERSAGHPFDVIVRAISDRELCEEAEAAIHKGDDYFANSNLNAWKIWYCLDNDVRKYAWADVENGKGVVYRMIDEWDNDCPYDFKNVMYKRFWVNADSPNGELSDLDGYYLGWDDSERPIGLDVDGGDWIWAYTFNHFQLDENGNALVDKPFDSTVYTYSGDVDFEGGGYSISGGVVNNVIEAKHITIYVDDSAPYIDQSLNNIVFYTFNNFEVSSDCSDMKAVKSNHIEAGCYDMTFLGKCIANKIGFGSHALVAGFVFMNNTFGNYCSSNTFGNYCYNNTFGNDCSGNTFGNGCSWNSFGNYVGWNGGNTFGNNCYRNSFGNYCSSNTFGNYCESNSFGNYCESNSFGNYCYNNTFGNYCYYNTFGNYVSKGTVFEDVSNVNVIGGINDSEVTQYFVILNGTTNIKGGNKLTINFGHGLRYAQFAGLNSDGELRIWTPADLV